SYTFQKFDSQTWRSMAKDYPVGSYIQFFYSDTTAAGRQNPILCSNTQFPATTTQFVWNFADTPSGAVADGIYHLYARLYDPNGILLDEDRTAANQLLIIDSNILNGIGLFDQSDDDLHFYVQNGATRQINLLAIYPDSVTAISYAGEFPENVMQIVSIEEGPAWQSVQNQGVIFEPMWNNSEGTFEVSAAVLGSNPGLVSGPPFFVVGVITVTVADSAVTPNARTFDGTFDVTSGTWTDYTGTQLDDPSLNDLAIPIGYLGDIATPSDPNRGTIPNMVPNPDGHFGVDDIVVFTQAWNGLGGTWDPIADIGPYQGQVPDLWATPDGRLDVHDLMAFTQMFDWYRAQNFTGGTLAFGGDGKPGNNNSPQDMDSEHFYFAVTPDGDRRIVELFADDVEALMTAELTLQFDEGVYELVDSERGEMLDGLFLDYPEEDHVTLYTSQLNPDQPAAHGTGLLGRVVLESTTGGDGELSVAFDLRNRNGAVIESGQTSSTAPSVIVPEIPAEFALEQNYPNPFNPTTTIRFGLPEASDVSLVVYNVMGREVVRLMEGELSAGWHAVQFDASRLASGVYFYRLEAGSFNATRKMVLFK
ncbi:T9SS type A sorting domain-containing protein, partial [bacterium]|nr:T9SS type A sorting domain-containing protein [bacterium]